MAINKSTTRKWAIFHKYHDGDFPCYGPDGAFYLTLEAAEKDLPKYDDESSEGKACIMAVFTKFRRTK